jgi:hypothetical protein
MSSTSFAYIPYPEGHPCQPWVLERVDLHAILRSRVQAPPTARMAIQLTAGLWLLTFFAPLTATTLAALLYPERFYFLPNAHKWTVDAQRIRLKDGRHLAYEVRGDISRQHVLIHNHGVLSSRCAGWCSCKVQACRVHTEQHNASGGAGLFC